VVEWVRTTTLRKAVPVVRQTRTEQELERVCRMFRAQAPHLFQWLGVNQWQTAKIEGGA
jgi:hypothetical protein